MASRIEKFNKKWGKTQGDVEAEYKARKEQESVSKEDKEEGKELKEQGNIEEAAMVLSKEGMKLFSTLFSNSVESAVENKLQDIDNRIGQVVEDKILEVINGITLGIQNHMKPAVENKVEEQIKESMQKSERPWSKDLINAEEPPTKHVTGDRPTSVSHKEPVPQPKPIQKDKPNTKDYSLDALGASKEELDIMVNEGLLEEGDNYLKMDKKSAEITERLIEAYMKAREGEVILAKEMTKTFNSIGVTFLNFHHILTNYTRRNINIEKIGKGQYVYKK